MPNLGTARAQRFHAYVERLSTALGHRDRHGPLRAYVTGLCLPGERKSIEPMAARVDPRHVRARHQSMQCSWRFTAMNARPQPGRLHVRSLSPTAVSTSIALMTYLSDGPWVSTRGLRGPWRPLAPESNTCML